MVVLGLWAAASWSCGRVGFDIAPGREGLNSVGTDAAATPLPDGGPKSSEPVADAAKPVADAAEPVDAAEPTREQRCPTDPLPWWSRDSDGDEFGDPTAQTQSCTQPDGYVANALDCDDGTAGRHPGRPELCDGLDNDCDTTTADACSPTWTARVYSGRVYQFSTDAVDWSTASIACRAQGMLLARLDSLEESNWVQGVAIELLGSNIWIGATDSAAEGIWRWEDGQTFWSGDANGSATGGAYTKWSQGEPNGLTLENCAELRLGGSWNDVACTTQQGFVCKPSP